MGLKPKAKTVHSWSANYIIIHILRSTIYSNCNMSVANNYRLFIISKGIEPHERTIKVTQCGRICIGRRKISFSTVFAGQHVGIREVTDDVWLVSFMDYDLGFFDRTLNRVEPVGESPFALTVLPTSSE